MEEISIFDGGQSYTNLEMNELFKFIDLNKKYNEYNILEFGDGSSSEKINNLFNKNVGNLNYYLFESNLLYIPKNQSLFKLIKYDENNIESIDLNSYIEQTIKFDLILLDGPDGEKRQLWYNKVKKFVKINSIILIDDFNHYKSFGEQLDKHFDYELLSYSDRPFEAFGEHSWKIVKITNIK
jgi:hypothetical protein